MSMREQGRAKLTEECGELLQILGKLSQYPEFNNGGLHPDGTNLRIRLEEEIADVYAALEFTIEKMGIKRYVHINRRIMEKVALFHQWDAEP